MAVGIVICLSACSESSSSPPSVGSNGPSSNLTVQPQGLVPAADEPESVLNDSSYLLTTNETRSVLNDSSYLLTTNETRMYKISAKTGAAEEIITFGGGVKFVEPLDIIGNTVYSTADDNTVNAIDLNTGKLLWEVRLGNPRNREIPTGVVCDQETCWAKGATGLLMAVSAVDGSEKWSIPLHPDGRNSEEELNGSDLLVTSDRGYLNTYKLSTPLFPSSVAPSLFIIDRSDGSIIKRVDLDYPAYSVPRVEGDTLVVSTVGEILAFDKNSFQLLWRINDPALRYTGAVIVNNVVVSGTYDSNDHYIVGIDLASGQQIWSVPAGSSENPYTSTTDGTLIYAMVGEFYSGPWYSPPGEAAMAINPLNGNIVWVDEGLSFAVNPLVALGHAYYGYHWDIRDGNADGVTSVNARTGKIEWVNAKLDTPGLDWFTRTPMLVHEGISYRTSLYPDVMP